jgi:hypothetical protein
MLHFFHVASLLRENAFLPREGLLAVGKLLLALFERGTEGLVQVPIPLLRNLLEVHIDELLQLGGVVEVERLRIIFLQVDHL